MNGDAADPRSVPGARWWQIPYFHLGLSILASAAAQILMKIGADHSSHSHEIFGFGALASGWTWLGILAHITSLLSWLYALRTAPLSIAFNLTGAIHVILPISSWIFLHEMINAQRWVGILLICAGVIITARQAGKAEEEL